jgi:hypothetical protein
MSAARRMRTGLAALPFVLATLGGLLLASPAPAADAPATAQAPAPSLTDDFSAADQYVESVPTARGPKVPGVTKSPRRGKSGESSAPKLSPSVKSSLEGQPAETAAQLERIATSPDYGAPAEELRKVEINSSARVPAAAVSAVGEGEEDTLTWLLVALIATTLLIAGLAAYRRYQSRNSAG